MDVTTTLQEVGTWPVADQIELLHGLWEHLIDAGWEPQLSEEQKTELERRIDDSIANPEKVLTWPEVVQRLRLPQ